MAKRSTVPLEITATLVDGRFNSVDGIVMFDSILYHAWFCKHAPNVLDGLGVGSYDGHVGLPLRQLPGNRWAASKGVYNETSKNIERWNKRPDFFTADKIDYLDMDKGLISDSIGIHRAYRVPNIIRTVEDGKIDFYCMGHADEILELLSYIPAIGKKPSMGWGMVSDWKVKEIEEDLSLWHPKHGLMRPVLTDECNDDRLEGYPIMDYGVKPPYWKTCNFRRCYVPNANA